jgi:tyrosinase
MAGAAVFKVLVASVLLFSSASASPFAKNQTTLTLDDVQKQALANSYKVLDGTLSNGLNGSSSCNKYTVAVRKEL